MTRFVPEKRGAPLRLQARVGGLIRSLGGAPIGGTDARRSEGCPFAVSEEAVTRVIEAWRERCSYLPGELLSDPAWGMLLELLQAEVQARRVSLPRLCKVSTVSASTGARWVEALVRQGLAVRRRDPLHQGEHFVELSQKGRSALRRYFHEIVDRSGPF